MEEYFKCLAGVGGAAASFLWGGWSMTLTTMFILVAVDYVTGVLAATIEKKLSSSAGMRGITRKILIFAIISIAHLVDQMIGTEHMIRDGTIFFYAANEILSILENCGRLGIPVPPKIREAIKLLHEKEKK